jgi:hypothetical protein
VNIILIAKTESCTELNGKHKSQKVINTEKAMTRLEIPRNASTVTTLKPQGVAREW